MDTNVFLKTTVQFYSCKRDTWEMREKSTFSKRRTRKR